MRMAFLRAAGLLVCILLAVAGCGDETTGTVQGTVKFGGKLVEKGAITFVPMDGNNPTAGGPIVDGQFSVRVPVGNAKVVINGTKVIGKKKIYNTPNSPEMPLTDELLPDKYNDKSQLQFDVKPGTSEKHFDLPR